MADVIGVRWKRGEKGVVILTNSLTGEEVEIAKDDLSRGTKWTDPLCGSTKPPVGGGDYILNVRRWVLSRAMDSLPKRKP